MLGSSNGAVHANKSVTNKWDLTRNPVVIY